MNRVEDDYESAVDSNGISLNVVYKHRFGIRRAWAVFVFNAFFCFFVLVMAASAFQLFAPFSYNISFYIFILFLAASWLIDRYLVNCSRKIFENYRLPRKNGDSSRLVCYGDKEELSRIHGIRKCLSDPFIVRFRYPSFREAVFLAISITLVCYLLLAIIEAPILRGMWITIILLLIAFFIYVRIIPTYCRISQGRFEVFNYSIFCSRSHSISEIDLTTAKVVCRYDQNTIEITPREETQSAFRLNLMMVRYPHEFVEAVFGCSLPDTQGPLLPRDRLVG